MSQFSDRMPPPARVEAIKDYLVFEGVEYKGTPLRPDTDALGKICRIIRSRFPSPAYVEVYRGDMLCMTVNVHDRAARTLEEADRAGLHFTKERKRPCQSTS